MRWALYGSLQKEYENWTAMSQKVWSGALVWGFIFQSMFYELPYLWLVQKLRDVNS